MDIADYKNIHKWLNRHHPKECCSKCDRTPEDGTILDWANVSGIHERDVKHYVVLCRRCHKQMDKFDSCASGHKYTEETLYLSPNGSRQCRVCRRTTWHRYFDSNPEYRENKRKRDKERVYAS